jgi:hypothetical protein
MRRAKAAELRDQHALARELLAEHKAVEQRRAAAAVAAEHARLASAWAPLAAEHAALQRTVELRDYQVEKAQAEVARVRARLEAYEPPWADSAGRFEVEPDASWAFLDERLFATLVEVGVRRGNLSKAGLVAALGAAASFAARGALPGLQDRGRSVRARFCCAS